MRDDLRNHTLWKHKWGWHNRGTILDTLVTERAQNNDRVTKGSEKDTIEDKRNFATFALDKMKLCTYHRKGKGRGKGKKKLSKVPRNLGLAHLVENERPDCTTLLLCGDSQVISQWTNGDFTEGGKYRKKVGASQRLLHQC